MSGCSAALTAIRPVVFHYARFQTGPSTSNRAFRRTGRGKQITFALRENADDRFDYVLYSCRSTASGRWPRIR
jgi:hypothetical protein